MSLEHPSCQEEEDYIRENYSEQASWCCGELEEQEEASKSTHNTESAKSECDELPW